MSVIFALVVVALLTTLASTGGTPLSVSAAGYGGTTTTTTTAASTTTTAAPSVAPPPPPPGAVSFCQATTAAGCSNAGVAVGAQPPNAIGGLTEAQYASNPTPLVVPGSTNEYFDVQVSTLNTFTSVTVTDCALGGGNGVYWLGNGSAPVFVTPQTLTGSCVTMTFSATSTPSITQLQGTPFGVGTAPAGVVFKRLAGTDRYGTAAAVAEATFPNGAGTVLLATGANYPDALAGNYLAGLDSAPILLTSTNAPVPASTLSAIQALKAKNVIILGGTNAVGQDVQYSLANTASAAGGKLAVSRLAGATRYDTMQQVDTQAGTAPGLVAGKVTAIVTSGANFPDGLAAGPESYAAKLPVVLTDPNTLSSQARSTLGALHVQQVLIMGGTAAVSSAVESAINSMGIPTLHRFAGQDRTDTAQQLATYAQQNLGFSTTAIDLARGDDFADALTGGPFGGANKTATVLTSTPTVLGTFTTNFLKSEATTLMTGTIFGGTAAVSATVATQAGLAG